MQDVTGKMKKENVWGFFESFTVLIVFKDDLHDTGSSVS